MSNNRNALTESLTLEILGLVGESASSDPHDSGVMDF